MKLTAVFEPAKEGGYACFVEEIPAAISQGETIEEAKANLADALKLAVQCQRELAGKSLSPGQPENRKAEEKPHPCKPRKDAPHKDVYRNEGAATRLATNRGQ